MFSEQDFLDSEEHERVDDPKSSAADKILEFMTFPDVLDELIAIRLDSMLDCTCESDSVTR